MLFDFDSLIEKEILQNSSEVRMSCSDGFSAPELVRGRRKEICEATDIYSLGAIVFYKVFGKVPSSWDRSFGAKYDLLAYLFFIKDCSRFLPIRAKEFDKRFELLGVDFKTSFKCSWENYAQYISCDSVRTACSGDMCKMDISHSRMPEAACGSFTTRTVSMFCIPAVPPLL